MLPPSHKTLPSAKVFALGALLAVGFVVAFVTSLHAA